jgi:hypothetical protein
MARWMNETNKLTGDEYRRHNPEWARAICWSMHDVACNMRPLTKEPTDG